MNHDKPKSKKSSELRKAAEERLKTKIISPEKMPGADIRKLIHELQVHQIELEMQNDELRKAQIALEASNRKYSDLYDFAPIGYLTLDQRGTIIETNLTAAELLHKKRGMLINKSLYPHINPEDGDIFYLYLKKVFESRASSTCEIRLKGGRGKEFYAHMNSIPSQDSHGNYTCRTSMVDVTERKQAEEKIRHIAFHDVLTTLPNRVLFNDRLTLALAHAHRTQEMLAVLFLDLDRFKVINDTLGHTMGDRLLLGVADRLKNSVREDDTVARLGGDEFSLLLPGITHREAVDNITRKVIEILRQSWMIGGHELYITASIGISLYPNDGKDAEILLKNADTAMYHAKERGRNNYQFYAPAMHAKSLEKMVLESDLRRALDRKEFVVYYLPLVKISTGKIVGMEALVRWQHPDRGLIFPGEFLPLSEDTRMIIPIDELVLRTVCTQNKAWQEAGFQPGCIAVNLSAHTFQQPNVVETVMLILQKTGLNPHFLGLELTEGIAMQDIESTMCKLNELSELGIQIAIDDFGTGFSSLSYLKMFPINKLKISPHFLSGIVTNQKDRMIVSSIIALAHGLQFRVIAEGVETEDQLILLKQLECDEMQGYLFCEPLSADEFEKMSVQDKFAHPVGTENC